MRNKTLFIFIILFCLFCLIVFIKSLNNSNIYIPEKISKNDSIYFVSEDLFSNIEIISDDIFENSNYYILNIWASWCVPCRNEHPYLLALSQNRSIKLIGLNYKDDTEHAKSFLNEMGNPYSVTLIDKRGIISIELGAYGVPETYIINKHKKIIRKFIGPLNQKIYNEIVLLLK